MRRHIAFLFIFCMTQNTLTFAQVSKPHDYRDIPNYIFLEGSLSDTHALEEATFVVLTREILLLHGGIDERDLSLIRQLSSAIVEASLDTLSGREMLQALTEIRDDECLPEETAEKCAERLALEEMEEQAKERGCEPDESELDCAVRKYGWTWTSGAQAAGGAGCDPSISNCAPFGEELDSGLGPGHSSTNAICAGGYRDPASGECVPPLPKLEGDVDGGGPSPPTEEEQAAHAAINATAEAFEAAEAAELAAEEAEIAAAEADLAAEAAKAAVLAKKPDGVLNDLKKKAEAAAEKAEKAAAKARAAATEAANKAEEAVKKAAGKVGSVVKQASEKAKQAAEKAAEKAKNAAEKAIDMAAKARKWAGLIAKFISRWILGPILLAAAVIDDLKSSIVTGYPHADCMGVGSSTFAADVSATVDHFVGDVLEVLDVLDILDDDWEETLEDNVDYVKEEVLREKGYESYEDEDGVCHNIG